MTYGALTGVVGRFDTFALQECPQPRAMFGQLVAHTGQTTVATVRTAQQQGVHRLAYGPHHTKPPDPRERAVAIASPVAKQLACFSHQLTAQPLNLMIV